MDGTIRGEALVVRPDEGEAIWFGPNRMTIKASGEETAGAYGLVSSWVPGGAATPWHVHHGVDEAFWILDGELRIRCGDEQLTAGPGSYVLLPRDVPHGYVAGEEDVRLLTIISPGGSEAFFAAAGRPAASAGLPPAGPPDVGAMARAAAAHDMEILGPPRP